MMNIGIARPVSCCISISIVTFMILAAGCTPGPPDRELAAAGSILGRPDFTGIWEKSFSEDAELISEFPFTDWGREGFEAAKPLRGPRQSAAFESNDPELSCSPMGIPATYFRPRPFEIVQFPERLLMLLEVGNFYRVIYTDGRDFPEDDLATWNGYAIGHYEGETLVVETHNFRGWESEDQQRWLDRVGHPFSDALILTERLRLVDQNTLENRITVDDSIAYTGPWTATLTFSRQEGVELVEFICHEADNAAFAEFERQILEYGNQRIE